MDETYIRVGGRWTYLYRAAVVVEADDLTITMYGPLHGERRISRQSCATGWAERGNLVLLIER